MASSDAEIKLDNFKDIEAQLKLMREDIAAKNMMAGLYNATKPTMDLAKVYAPEDTGLLKKSITRKKLVYPKQGVAMVIVGAGSGVIGVDKYGKKRWPIKYAHLVKKNDPFIEDAAEATKDQIEQRLKAFLERRIKKYFGNPSK